MEQGDGIDEASGARQTDVEVEGEIEDEEEGDAEANVKVIPEGFAAVTRSSAPPGMRVGGLVRSLASLRRPRRRRRWDVTIPPRSG